MSDSTKVPIIVGLIVGIGFIVTFALIMNISLHFRTPPEMSLIITSGNRSQTYKTSDNVFCEQVQCDFLFFARVLPSSANITVDHESSQLAFRTGHLGQRQPDRLDFVIQKLESDGRDGLHFIDTGLQLQKVGEERYQVGKDWSPGKYVLGVIASWEHDSNSNQSIPNFSLHRFNLVIR